LEFLELVTWLAAEKLDSAVRQRRKRSQIMNGIGGVRLALKEEDHLLLGENNTLSEADNA
jgi:hypothetical protein